MIEGFLMMLDGIEFIFKFSDPLIDLVGLRCEPAVVCHQFWDIICVLHFLILI